MPIKKLFDEAQRIIAEECMRNRTEDLLRQYDIIKNRKCERLTAEPDIINNLVVQATSYSVVRKFFNVLYSEDIFLFDKFYSSDFFKFRTEPSYTYEDWVNIVLNWGNKLLSEVRLSSNNSLDELVSAIAKGFFDGYDELNPKKPRTRIVLALATALPLIKREILSDPVWFFNKCNQ